MSQKKKYQPADQVSMTQADRDALEQYGRDYNRYDQEERQALAAVTDPARRAELQRSYQSLKDAAHAQAQAVRARYGYSGGPDGSEYKPFERENTVKAPDLRGELSQWKQEAAAQQQAQIDYAVDQGVVQLERAEEEAQAQFQTQQDLTEINEARALDDQALYAEVRGDRGGIGQAQYGQIRAAALQSRQAIQSARVKLSADTARQITDLRAQGEFQKADALLELTQSYLTRLMDLEQWTAEYDLKGEQFAAQLSQWQAEYGLDLQKLLYDREQGLQSALNSQRDALAQSGLASLAVGVRPSAAQQQAMGYTDAQITAAIAQYKAQQAARQTSSGGSSDPSNSVTLISQQRRLLAEAGNAALKVGLRPTREQQEVLGLTDDQVSRIVLNYWQEVAAEREEKEWYGM